MSNTTYPYEPITQRRLSDDDALDLARSTELALCRHCGGPIWRPIDFEDQYAMESWRRATNESTFCPAGGDSEQFCEPVRLEDNDHGKVIRNPEWIKP